MIKLTHSLRARIFISYLGLGVFLALLMISMEFFYMETIEHKVIDANINDELSYFIKTTKTLPQNYTLKSAHWTAYKVAPGTAPETFASLAGYNTGLHEIINGGKQYDVAIREQDGARYYLIVDDTEFEAYEKILRSILIFIVILIVFTSASYGFWLSRKVTEPITSLASRVSELEPVSLTYSLARDYSYDDEVGALARTFDAYTRRLSEFISREQEFTADASHELRTPLTVIKIASESLLTRDDLTEEIRNKILRIEKAANTMSGRLSLLLTLSREIDNENELDSTAHIDEILKQAIHDLQPSLADSVDLITEYSASPLVVAPVELVSILIGNLLKNAFSYTRKGNIKIILDETSLAITDTGIGIPRQNMDKLFTRGYRGSDKDTNGYGLGLSISKRICDRYGWDISIESSESEGTRVIWEFT